MTSATRRPAAGSFRRGGGRDGDCLLEPRWLRIAGYWHPRGGIPIDVCWQSGLPAEGVWLPGTAVQGYRRRG